MIVAGLLAGRGVYIMAEKVIQRCIDDPLIQAVWVLAPTVGNRDFMAQDKIRHIHRWLGANSHDKTGINRELLRSQMYGALSSEKRFEKVKWIWIGDEDALPAPDYFEKLLQIEYGDPVLLTGKTFNADGQRWYDICSFQTDHFPFCVPYDDWRNPRWAKDLYASGNQHVMNRSGFALNVGYINHPGEDPHYCWAFKDAGGKLVFRPELSMTLLKMHGPANLGFAPCLPK